MTAYWGKLNGNPKKFSNDIEIRSGTSATAEAIADEYADTLVYEPGVGSTYHSTSGQLFIHHKAGDDANTWSLVTDALQPDLESFNATLSLASSIIKAINKLRTATITLAAGTPLKEFFKGASISLAGAILKDITFGESVTMTLTPSVLTSLNGA